METILVTGGAGFIGTHVTREMVARGYRVRILDSFLPQVHAASAFSPPKGVEVIEGDVCDAATVTRALEGVGAVVHLAAEVGVGQSMYEFSRYVGANDFGTATLLEALIDAPVRRIVVASSMSVYGEGTYRSRDGRLRDTVRRSRAEVEQGRWDPVDETGAALEPVPTDETKTVELASIYALTKFVQERATLLFGDAYDTDAVALRLFNVFGPGQALSNPYTGVLANFSARIAVGKRPLVFEDGAQRRDFVHVRDVARAFRLALETPGIGGKVFNIGSGRPRTIASIAEMVARAMGRPDLQPEILGRARAGDIRNCFADISLARDLMGYAPAHQLEDSLDEMTEWVRGESVVDNSAEMRAALEARGLVS